VTFLLKETLVEKGAVVLVAVSCSQGVRVGPSEFGLFPKMERIYIEGFKQLKTYRRRAKDWF